MRDQPAEVPQTVSPVAYDSYMLRVVVVVVVACVVVPRLAHAQSKSPSADALFAEGQRLIDAHKIDEACEKFLASLQLDPALGTRLNLADCRERQDRFVEAYQLYSEVVDEAMRGGKQSQLAFARQRLDSLALRLVRVTLKVADPQLAGLIVKVGGKPRAPAEWARTIAIEPGAIAVSATAPDHDAFEVSRDAQAGDQITIEIPPLAVHATAVVETKPVALQPARPPHTLTPWIVGGSGAVVVIASMVLGVHAKAVDDTGLAQPAPAGNSDIHTAVTEANVATGLFAAGVIAMGVGGYLYFRESRASVAPISDGHGAGVAIRAAW